MKRLTLLFILSLGLFQGYAQSDLGARQLEHEDGVNDFFCQEEDNPALKWGRYTTSLNRLKAYYDGRHANTAPQLEQGDGHSLFGGDAQAFLRKEKISLWGHAKYQKGTIRNVKYSESEDFDLLYPYVIADTIGGGKSRVESYDFMGGVAYQLGKWLVGAQGEYIAQLDYRTRDPRPKNLSGDLHVAVGGAYAIDSYNLGLSLGYQRYKQTNEVEIYDEVSMPVFYHLTGLGTDYYRFRGTYTDTYYKGHGWTTSLSLQPKGNRGVYAHAGYRYFTFDKIISDLNQLPMTTMQRYAQDAALGYQSKGKIHNWGVKLTEKYQRSNGTENVFGSPAGNIYPSLSSGILYKMTTFGFAGTGIYQYHPQHALYETALTLGRHTLKESHIDPDRLLTSKDFSTEIALKALWNIKRWTLKANAGWSYTWNTDADLQLSGTVNTSMIPQVYQRYAWSSQDRYAINGGVEAGYDTGKKFLVFLRSDLSYAHYAESCHTRVFNISAGIEF